MFKMEISYSQGKKTEMSAIEHEQVLNTHELNPKTQIISLVFSTNYRLYRAACAPVLLIL